MADILSILSANYKTVGTDRSDRRPRMSRSIPTLYEGSWTGKYANNKTFKITISNVRAFAPRCSTRAAAPTNIQEVLIKDNSFRIGDTKFTLTESERRRSRTSSPIRRAARPFSTRPYASRSS